MAAEEKLTEIPRGKNGFLGFPINTDLNNIDAHIAVLEHFHFMLVHSLRLRGSSSIGLG